MALPSSGAIIYHNALGLELDSDRFILGGLGFLDTSERQQLGQGAEIKGEANEVTSRVVLLHGVNGFCKHGLVFADDQFGDGGALDCVGLRANDINPRRADPSYGAVEVEVYDDIECLFGSFSKVFPFFSDVLAQCSLHCAASSLCPKGGDCRRRESMRVLVHGGDEAGRALVFSGGIGGRVYRQVRMRCPSVVL